MNVTRGSAPTQLQRGSWLSTPRSLDAWLYQDGTKNHSRVNKYLGLHRTPSNPQIGLIDPCRPNKLSIQMQILYLVRFISLLC
jgi:hypothetical protein